MSTNHGAPGRPRDGQAGGPRSSDGTPNVQDATLRRTRGSEHPTRPAEAELTQASAVSYDTSEDDPNATQAAAHAVSHFESATPRPTLRPGFELRRYRLEQRLGAGGMGEVWKAIDLLRVKANDPRPHVAIKVLGRDFAAHPKAFIALQREASKAMELAHPNIATVHEFDFDEYTGHAFVSMELLTGTSLDKLIANHPGGVSARVALRIIRDLATGLAYAHTRGIVHCDFKPGNAVLLEEGVAKVLDFGIARVVRGSARDVDSFDAGEFGALTPAYATREIIDGADPLPADDVYALGLVAYELLVGRHPYGGTDGAEAASGGSVPAPIRRKGVNRREAQAIIRALTHERAQRYPDAGVFLKALERTNPWIPSLAGLAALLAVTAGYAWYQTYLESRPSVPFEQLPVNVQSQFRQAMSLGDTAYRGALAMDQYESAELLFGEAIPYYAEAYGLHPKNPEADQALMRSFELLGDKLNDADPQIRDSAREKLETYRERFPVLKRYEPMMQLVDSLEE